MGNVYEDISLLCSILLCIALTILSYIATLALCYLLVNKGKEGNFIFQVCIFKKHFSDGMFLLGKIAMFLSDFFRRPTLAFKM